MVSISDEQVDFILQEIEARGVTIEDLQRNLLDHMCCIIENEMSENDDFDQFFRRLLPRFFNDNLREIQEETELLLTFKHFYAMKKTLVISGLLASVFTLIGSFFKVMHWPGAGISLVLGIGIFGMIFLPLMIALKFRDEAKTVDKLVLSFGLLTGIITTFGFLFKIMHWPFANVMMFTGLVSFTFIFTPVYFFSRVRRPELKFNAIVNSVLMLGCGGLLFAMMNLNKQKSDDANQSFYKLLSSEMDLMAYQNQGNLDSVQKIEFSQVIDKLNQQVLELKTQIFMASAKISKTEFSKMNETEAFSLIPNDQTVKQVMSDEMYLNWASVLSEIRGLNAQIDEKLPDPKLNLKISIQSSDLVFATTKVGVQQLTVIQMHLGLLKIIAT